jgi:hypothetical protein
MILTNTIREMVISDRGLRLKIALKLDLSEQAVRNNATRNNPNNTLTTHSALECIKKETGLTIKEILEEEKALA